MTNTKFVVVTDASTYLIARFFLLIAYILGPFLFVLIVLWIIANGLALIGVPFLFDWMFRIMGTFFGETV